MLIGGSPDDPIHLGDALREVDRELGQRDRVYARLIQLGKMTQPLADAQKKRLGMVRRILVALVRSPALWEQLQKELGKP